MRDIVPQTDDTLREEGDGVLTVPAVHSGNGDIVPLWKVERDVIEQAIEACDGNIPKAATKLGVSPSTIYRKKLTWESEKAEG